MGFDDVQSAAFQNPGLTTVRQPLRTMGILAAEAIIRQIASPAEHPSSRQVVVDPELVVRESTCPIFEETGKGLRENSLPSCGDQKQFSGTVPMRGMGHGMAKYLGAMDQGTTSTRFLVFDRAGRVIASAQKEHQQIYPEPGWVEHDPAEIWLRTREVIAEAMAQRGLSPPTWPLSGSPISEKPPSYGIATPASR